MPKFEDGAKVKVKHPPHHKGATGTLSHAIVLEQGLLWKIDFDEKSLIKFPNIMYYPFWESELCLRKG